MLLLGWKDFSALFLIMCTAVDEICVWSTAQATREKAFIIWHRKPCPRQKNPSISLPLILASESIAPIQTYTRHVNIFNTANRDQCWLFTLPGKDAVQVLFHLHLADWTIASFFLPAFVFFTLQFMISECSWKCNARDTKGVLISYKKQSDCAWRNFPVHWELVQLTEMKNSGRSPTLHPTFPMFDRQVRRSHRCDQAALVQRLFALGLHIVTSTEFLWKIL